MYRSHKPRVAVLALQLALLGARAAFAAFPSPSDWADENIYQVFTDRFFDGDPSNNNVEAGRGSPYAPGESRGVHGGDFKGIQQKLDYIKALGATAIWISPIPLNVGGDSAYHGYAAQDFYALAPHWGTMTDLSNMVAAAHARGIKVVLDVVVNHSGDLISGGSGYPNFLAPPAGYVMHYNDSNQQHAPPFNITNATPPDFTSIFHTNGVIQDFGDAQQTVLGELFGLDDFATETTYVRTNMMNIYTNWVGRADFDGFRIDTTKHVDYGFWQYWCPQLHQFANSIGKSNLFMFGEAFDGSESLVGSYTGTIGGGPFKLDSMLDYPLFFTINPIFAQNYANTKLIEDHYNNIAANYDSNAWYRLVTFLDNHDNSRFLNSGNANDDTNKLTVALIFLYTSRGIPCLYYGTEQAFDGGGDPNDREDMFAGQFEQGPSLGDNFNETHPLFQLVAKLNNFRRRYPSLRRGVHNNLFSDASSPGLFAYSRVLRNEEVFVAFNTASFSKTLTNCPTSYAAGTTLVNLLNTNETITVVSSTTNTTPLISVPGTSAKLFIAQSQLRPFDPVVTSQSPAHAVTNVPIASPVVLKFSKPMDTNSVQAAFSTTPPKPGTFTWSALRDTMTFTPSAPGWPPLTTNLVHLSTNAMDSISGRTVYAPFDTYFFTLPDIAIAGSVVIGGNSNGLVDPDECNLLNILVQNLGVGTASVVNATLYANAPGVSVIQPLSAYPNILPGAVATNSTPFKISTSPPFACGSTATLTLALTYATGTNNLSCVLPGVPNSYTVTQSNNVSIVSGTSDTGNHVDDSTTTIALPFTYTFYGQPFNNAALSSNGNLQFLSSDNQWINSCLAYNGFNYAILPFWDDLRTDCSGGGIFTSVSGVAPNRIFNIEWRATYYNASCTGAVVNFEVRLYENQTRFDIIYGTLNGNGNTATVGIQKDTGSSFSQFECNSGGPSNGLMLTYQIPCTAGGGACPPVANFTGTPTNGPAPLAVSFADTSVGVITNRSWNFGDNSTTNILTNGVSHTYASGIYPVTLVVTGPGLISTNTKPGYIVAFSAFQLWQIQYFGSINNPQASQSADPDSDGYHNLQEFFSGSNPTNAASYPPNLPPNLLAWWKLDEAAATVAGDSALNGNTGTLSGPSWEWTSGLFGSALRFAGQDQLAVSNSAPLNPTQAITLSAWVNADNWFNFPRILEKGKSNNQYGLLVNASGKLAFALYGVTNGILTSDPPSEEAWHHIVGTYNSSLLRLYIDGQVITQQTASGLIPSSSDPLAIGSRPGATIFYDFQGAIDEVQIYGRALSASEVTLLYNKDTVGDGIANWWRLYYFGDPSTTSAVSCATCDSDQTGQNNLFKFVAGLDPADPASVFRFQIGAVTNHSADLRFLPLAFGRTYAPQFSTNLTLGNWIALAAYSGPFTNGSQITITDTNATDLQKFYRIRISLP